MPHMSLSHLRIKQEGRRESGTYNAPPRRPCTCGVLGKRTKKHDGGRRGHTETAAAPQPGGVGEKRIKREGGSRNTKDLSSFFFFFEIRGPS